jgi:predicted Zn-dependent protease
LSARLDRLPPDVAALTEFANLCHANGQLEAAANAYRALIKLEPGNARWPYRLASILAGYGRLDDALPLLRTTLQLAPDYFPARLTLGESLLKHNATAEAETVYRDALQREANNPYAMLGLARCDLDSRRWTSARAQLQRAVAAHPDFSDAHSLLASVFERLGNVDGAELERKRVQDGGHSVEPTDPWLEELINDCLDPYTLLIAASTAMAERRPNDALARLERGLELAPDNARLHRQLAKTKAVLGDLPTARLEMEKAVALEPSNDAIHLDLLAYLRQPSEAEALARAISRAVAACPTSPALQCEAAALAVQQGHLDEGAEHYLAAWRQSPDQTAAALEAATLYFRQKQPDRAVALLEDVLARRPEDSATLLMLLRHSIEGGEPRAADLLRRAREANASPTILAELNQRYQRRFGVVP